MPFTFFAIIPILSFPNDMLPIFNVPLVIFSNIIPVLLEASPVKDILLFFIPSPERFPSTYIPIPFFPENCIFPLLSNEIAFPSFFAYIPILFSFIFIVPIFFISAALE